MNSLRLEDIRIKKELINYRSEQDRYQVAKLSLVEKNLTLEKNVHQTQLRKLFAELKNIDRKDGSIAGIKRREEVFNRILIKLKNKKAEKEMIDNKLQSIKSQKSSLINKITISKEQNSYLRKIERKLNNIVNQKKEQELSEDLLNNKIFIANNSLTNYEKIDTKPQSSNYLENNLHQSFLLNDPIFVSKEVVSICNRTPLTSFTDFKLGFSFNRQKSSSVVKEGKEQLKNIITWSDPSSQGTSFDYKLAQLWLKVQVSKIPEGQLFINLKYEQKNFDQKKRDQLLKIRELLKEKLNQVSTDAVVMINGELE